MPRLIRDWLGQQVEGKHRLHMSSVELAELARTARDGQRQTVYAILGTGLLIAATVLYSFDRGGVHFLSLTAATWIAMLGALGAFLAAWPRR
jgi:ubiquinone biosynthesis protein